MASVRLIRGETIEKPYCICNCTYHVPHVGCSEQVHPVVIRPLNLVHLRTIRQVARPIPEMIVLCHESHSRRPVPGPLSPVLVRTIPRILGQSRSKIEKPSRRDGILIAIPVIPGKDLPAQPTTTGGHVPPRCLRIKRSLSHSQPSHLVVGGIREIPFCCRHRRETPEGLVVVTFRLALVIRHEGSCVAGLPEKTLRRDVVPCVVAGEIPVVDERVEHRAGFPPIVWIWEVAGVVARSVAVIVFHHVHGY